MKSTLIWVIMALLLTSCQAILLKMYGFEDPDIETEQSILAKAAKFKLDTTHIVTVHSKDFLEVLKGQSIPDGAVYDAYGKYIEYRKTDSTCNAGLFRFIPELDPAGDYRKTDRPGLQEELAKFRDLKGQPLGDPGKADFYLLIYWTVWTGKLNKDHVKVWEELAGKNKKANIRVIKVNLDLQSYWEEEDRERILKAIRK
jgi:hypothetical protein